MFIWESSSRWVSQAEKKNTSVNRVNALKKDTVKFYKGGRARGGARSS